MAEDRGVSVYFDQDLFVPLLNEDRDYTMGFAIEMFNKKGTNIFDGVLCNLAQHFKLNCSNNNAERSYVLGTVNYTPDDISSNLPIQDDRPYASLVYFSNKRVIADGDSAIGVELQVGFLGLKFGEEFQDYFHKRWRDASGNNTPVDPRGWRNQISDGGEATLRFRLSNLQVLKNRHQSKDKFDYAWMWDAAVGYQTNASTGLMARAGKIRSSIWTVPYDPINRGDFLPSTGGSEWYFWVAGRTRLIGYDALLQGQFRNSHVTFNS
ncbi:MAG: lipid A deacylase LpxR family protein, partial [Gammaproteobacteria bacterium]|nr:lipid A deacylase LpxR family protein [Gammaproteobacteria bacterium]